MITKTKIRTMERRWRMFVDQGPLVYIYLGLSALLLVAAIFSPLHIREFLIHRCFGALFGLVFLAFSISQFLSACVCILSRDKLGVGISLALFIILGLFGFNILGWALS